MNNLTIDLMLKSSACRHDVHQLNWPGDDWIANQIEQKAKQCNQHQQNPVKRSGNISMDTTAVSNRL